MRMMSRLEKLEQDGAPTYLRQCVLWGPGSTFAEALNVWGGANGKTDRLLIQLVPKGSELTAAQKHEQGLALEWARS